MGSDQGLFCAAARGRIGRLQCCDSAPERRLVEGGSMLKAGERATELRGRGKPDPFACHRRQQFAETLDDEWI